MIEPIHRVLMGYMVVCCGVGAMMGSRGFPVFYDFFSPAMYYLGVALIVTGMMIKGKH